MLSVAAFWLPTGVRRACVSLTPRYAHWVAAVGEYRANLFAEPRRERGSECGAVPAPRRAYQRPVDGRRARSPPWHQVHEKHTQRWHCGTRKTLRLARHERSSPSTTWRRVLADVRDDLGQVPRVRQDPVLRPRAQACRAAARQFLISRRRARRRPSCKPSSPPPPSGSIRRPAPRRRGGGVVSGGSRRAGARGRVARRVELRPAAAATVATATMRRIVSLV